MEELQANKTENFESDEILKSNLYTDNLKIKFFSKMYFQLNIFKNNFKTFYKRYYLLNNAFKFFFLKNIKKNNLIHDQKIFTKPSK